MTRSRRTGAPQLGFGTIALFGVVAACRAPAAPPPPAPSPPADTAPVAADVVARAKAALLATHGEASRARIERGVDQVAALWRAADGDLVAFCAEQFAGPQAAQDALFDRLEAQLEQLEGHAVEMQRTLRWHAEVDTGPNQPIDDLLAATDPGAHLVDDLFTSKVAFAVLLNWPLIPLAQQNRDAATYSRRQWAELALTRRFDRRFPAAIGSGLATAQAAADAYVADYNLWMHHVLGEHGERRFPAGMRLISHWNLRDELKADYALDDGGERQRTILRVMERIVSQSIPAAVIDNPRLDWNPFDNTVTPAPAATVEADAPAARPTAPSTVAEADVRYARILASFAAERAADRYAPACPTSLDRAFDDARLPESRVRDLLLAVLESPLAAATAREIGERLGRQPLPQDVWYQFVGATVPEAELDELTRARYPTAAAFAADLPRLLRDLGFGDEATRALARTILVDPSRGAGHAYPARRRGDQPHLRTRIGAAGMDYKSYNIAVHELGHNVEQYFSLYEIDHPLLAGVPDMAITEALAFLFQHRDLRLLGRPVPAAADRRAQVLDSFWAAREIAGSALVEIEVWHWLYAHADATPAELRATTMRIARDTWDRFYAPYLGGAGETTLLAIYSHTITLPLYLFHYALGHLVAFQLEQAVGGRDATDFAAEYARIARLGAILPDAWMRQATGAPVSAEGLLTATADALRHPD
ncbi:MAG: hypothetical protein U1E73_10390 [Planctomycetota bacterium]